MKKIHVLSAMCMAAVLAMTGCGGSESAPATAAETAAPATQAAAGEAEETSEAAAEQAAEPEIILKYSEVNPDGHFLTDTAYYFADQVAEKSNGRIKIDIYPAGQLANEKDGIQTIQTSSGVIDIVRCSTSSLSYFGVQKLNVLSMPYIIRDREHYWNVAQSDVGEELKAEPQELGLGMVGLFYVDEGFRHFFTVDPVNSIEDLDGMKLRVPTTELMSDTVAAFGAISTPISFSELYSSLQTGTVDGAEQPLSGYYSNRFQEVAPNLILDGHVYGSGMVCISEQAWNMLSAEDQQVLIDAGLATEEYNKNAAQENDDEMLELLKAEGVNVVEVPDKTEWQNKVADVIAKYSAGMEDIVERISAQ